MSRRKRKKTNVNTMLIIIVLLVGAFLIYKYIKPNNTKEKTTKITNNIEEKNEKKNYNFKRRSISCDNLVELDNSAIYINDGDIYYITYENELFKEYKLVTKGKNVGIEDNELVGYLNKDSVIDINYAKKVKDKNYVVFIEPKKEETEKQDETNNDYFKEYKEESEILLRGGGYAGASNKAVSLKNNIAYFLRFNGDNLVSSEKIATNVKKIANIGDDHDKIIVVYIEDNTILEDKYKDYEIMEDDNGKKCIKIC